MLQAKPEIFTYQTRLDTEPDQAALPVSDVLTSYAELMSRVERKLFADIQRGKKAADLKSVYLTKFRITARHFNSIRIQLEAKIDAIKKLRSMQIQSLKDQIKSSEEKIRKLKRKKDNSNKIHQKNRRLFRLKNKLNRLKQDEASGTVRLCFGSKK